MEKRTHFFHGIKEGRKAGGMQHFLFKIVQLESLTLKKVYTLPPTNHINFSSGSKL